MIGAACESAEKIIADARKSYFGTRQGTNLLPTIDKVQAAQIQEQENLLRSAVNHGEGANSLLRNSWYVMNVVVPRSISVLFDALQEPYYETLFFFCACARSCFGLLDIYF